MFRLILSSVIPVYVLIYTGSFARWMQRRGDGVAAASAYILGIVACSVAGFALWRLFI